MTRTELSKLFAKPQWYDAYGRPVLDTLLNADRSEGLSANTIAAKLGIDPDVATEALRKLVHIEMADHTGRIRDKQLLFEATLAARRSVLDKRYRPMVRKCMTCPDQFLSTGAHHRICDGCKEYDDLEEGVAA